VTLPFTESDFLAVLATYNKAMWLVVLLTWALAFVVLLGTTTGARSARLPLVFVAALWAWSGVVFHGIYFSAINPAAWAFAALFILEAAGLFVLAARAGRFAVVIDPTVRGWTAAVLMLYAVIYPILVWLSGLWPPEAPVFAVPCPTVIFTAGLLLAIRPRVPRWLYVGPVVWTVIGGSAAFFFGVWPDAMMFPAGLALLYDAATNWPRREHAVADEDYQRRTRPVSTWTKPERG
jgi:hypothetical protein